MNHPHVSIKLKKSRKEVRTIYRNNHAYTVYYKKYVQKCKINYENLFVKNY